MRKQIVIIAAGILLASIIKYVLATLFVLVTNFIGMGFGARLGIKDAEFDKEYAKYNLRFEKLKKKRIMYEDSLRRANEKSTEKPQ